MTHTGLEGELLPSDEPMPFNDRPYFRIVLENVDENDVSMVAELVEVLGAGSN